MNETNEESMEENKTVETETAETETAATTGTYTGSYDSGSAQAATATGIPQKPINYVTGVVGALLGVIIGTVLWVVIFQFGYIAGFAGFVMMICSFKGFELLGGRINIPGIIICALMDFAAIYFAHNIAYAVGLMQEMTETKLTFSAAYQSIPRLIDAFEEFADAYYHDLIVGYGLAAVAIIPNMIDYIRKRKL